MSKSKGNVINPDEIVDEFGADAFRVYEMFMGPFDQTAPWSMESIRGCMKFLGISISSSIVATFMTMVNEFYKEKQINKAEFATFLQLLNPFAPHMTEELYQKIGGKEELAYKAWPTYDEAKTIEDEIEIPVQIKGKVRATITIKKDEDEEVVKQKAKEAVAGQIEGKRIIKEIYVNKEENK